MKLPNTFAALPVDSNVDSGVNFEKYVFFLVRSYWLRKVTTYSLKSLSIPLPPIIDTTTSKRLLVIHTPKEYNVQTALC
jgi:hypothetical protein